MEALSSLFPEELIERLELQPSFRGGQIFSWIHRGITNFESMSDLPRLLRERLAEQCRVTSTKIDTLHPDEAGNVKLRILLEDDLAVEAVLLKDEKGRHSACLSSQVGCAMGCHFCRTGEMGLKRNLSAGEIVEQFLHMEGRFGEISNIVFMGMGEPLANFTAFTRAVKILNHPRGRNLGIRRMTVSTCGLIPEICRLGSEGPPLRLAVSLNSPRQEVRERIMPIARRYPLPMLKKTLLDYQAQQPQRITLEYVLLGGINDSSEDAKALIRWMSNLKAMVNLIPWNPLESIPFKTSSEGAIRRFQGHLEAANIPVTRRRRRGRGINGACGQLGEALPADESTLKFLAR